MSILASFDTSTFFRYLLGIATLGIDTYVLGIATLGIDTKITWYRNETIEYILVFVSIHPYASQVNFIVEIRIEN